MSAIWTNCHSSISITAWVWDETCHDVYVMMFLHGSVVMKSVWGSWKGRTSWHRICFSVCAHQVWRGPIYFWFNTCLWGPYVSTSQYRCVWMCIYAWNNVTFVVCLFFLSNVFLSLSQKLLLMLQFLCTINQRGIAELGFSWTYLWREYRPWRFQRVDHKCAGGTATLLSVQSNTSIVTVLVKTSWTVIM